MPGGYANHYIMCASTDTDLAEVLFKNVRDRHNLRFIGGHNYRSSQVNVLHGATPAHSSNQLFPPLL